MDSPIADLAGLTLEVNSLDRALVFYRTLFGLEVGDHDAEHGWATLRVGRFQTLTLWEPVTRRPYKPELEGLHPRGAAHLHYAWQILPDDFDLCRQILAAHGCTFEEIDLGTPERPDVGLYFFDPFGHGLELRTVNPDDPRRPRLPLGQRPASHSPGDALPVIGLREVALAFGDYPAMLERLPRAYGFALAKEQPDRDFAQFTLGPQPEEDGNGTPRRWLYAWDPQVGLAQMLGGDHALVEFYADVPAVLERVRRAGLPHLSLPSGLAARDPEGHVFLFREVPE
ncbi:bleomycin resistance protein [Deinococcus irradiatisoli]|uniref:Bleomycin resistance protein n=1 Tax=Deinococcus irradiatisoli TaxID=2202254 RepID=A0A2Z3JIA2_9DEIO|nr:VOC family protein [Deinococcus irradiatisoli]AWN22699.1 bleomycin resistance protein [Deinococcus irradiatisoli]